jgi:hypothetical protein
MLAGRTRSLRGRMWLLDFNGNGVWDRPSTDRLYWLEQAEDMTLTGKGSLVRRMGQRGTSNEYPRFPPAGRTWPCAD